MKLLRSFWKPSKQIGLQELHDRTGCILRLVDGYPTECTINFIDIMNCGDKSRHFCEVSYHIQESEGVIIGISSN